MIKARESDIEITSTEPTAFQENELYGHKGINLCSSQIASLIKKRVFQYFNNNNKKVELKKRGV